VRFAAARACVLFNFDLAQFGKVIEDTLPFEALGLVRGETIHQLLAQQEREECAEHVTADSGIGFVEDGPRRISAFAVLKASSTASRLR